MATTYELIDSVVLGSDTATVSFTSIPGTFDDLILVCSARSARSNPRDFLYIEFNGSSTGYSARALQGTSTSAISYTGTSIYAVMSADTATANTFGSAKFYVPNYAGSTNKSVSLTSASENNSASTNYANITEMAGLWSNTSAITSIELGSNNSENLKSGSSFYLYGITKA